MTFIVIFLETLLQLLVVQQEWMEAIPFCIGCIMMTNEWRICFFILIKSSLHSR
jgi:hypothetical protein